MQKMKKILLGKYPRRRITALLLCLSVVILCMVFKDEGTVTEEPDVITGSIGQAEKVAASESDSDGDCLSDTKESEIVSVDEKVEESLATEEILPKELEGGEALEVDVVASEETSVPESISMPEVWIEPDTIEVPKGESGEKPQKPIIPEVTPEPEILPTPESTPEPEETSVPHEHSWIFESWYQEPTCSNGGLVIEICVHCGETQITGGKPTEEHSFRLETPGDCLSEEVVVCTECNYREVREKNLSNHIDVEEGFCYGCGQKTQ